MNAPVPPSPKPAPPRRMTLSAVTTGKVARPLRVLLYGTEGIGKSTFAASAPSPIFLGAEDGSALLDVARFPQPESWADVMDAVRTLVTEEHSYQTLVIDSVDWTEPLCWAAVCAAGKKPDIEAFPYGKGYTAALERWRSLIVALDTLRARRNMSVILVGHAHVKGFKNPEGPDFERYQLALHEKASGALRQWADELIFARAEVFVSKEGQRAKGISGERIAHTAGCAAFDAKSRHGLPERLPFSWADFAAAIEEARNAAPALKKDIGAALSDLERLAPDVAAKARAFVGAAGDDVAKLRPALNTIRARIAEHSAARASDDTTASDTHSNTTT